MMQMFMCICLFLGYRCLGVWLLLMLCISKMRAILKLNLIFLYETKIKDNASFNGVGRILNMIGEDGVAL